MDTGICELIITGPTGDLLPDLARELVATRLAASANVWTAPVSSTYWWDGKLQTAVETRVHLLTRTDLLDRLTPSSENGTPTTFPTSPPFRSSPGTPTSLAGSRVAREPYTN